MRFIGLLRMSNQLPQVMEDVTEDAKSHMQVCGRCDGEKVIQFTRANKTTSKKCPDCKGTGEVRVVGDKHARDLVFESMKLTRQREGPIVAIQQNIGAGGGLSAKLEDLLKQTQSVILEAPRNEPNAVEDQTPSPTPK